MRCSPSAGTAIGKGCSGVTALSCSVCSGSYVGSDVCVSYIQRRFGRAGSSAARLGRIISNAFGPKQGAPIS